MTVITTQPPQFSHSKVQEIIQSIYGFEVSVSTLDSERDQNFLLKGKNGDSFVDLLKKEDQLIIEKVIEDQNVEEVIVEEQNVEEQ